MEEEMPSRPRMMTHPGTTRRPFTRSRLSMSLNSAKNGLKRSRGSGKIWVVQVSPSPQATENEKKQANQNPSSKSLHHKMEDDVKERNLNSLQTELRAVDLLSREYDSVLHNTYTATKRTSKLRSSTKTGSFKPEPHESGDTMLAGMIPALFLGQCFSVLGVSNAAGKHGKPPVFRWLSFRVLYSAVLSALFATHAILAARDHVMQNNLSLESYQIVVFYSSGFIASCLYVRLASRWASLCSAFEHMENRMSVYGNSNGLRRRMRSLTAVVLILALVEHSLAQLNTVVATGHSLNNPSIRHRFERYYERDFSYIRPYLPFSPFAVASCVAANATATFIWNFNDLFIMLISVAISWRFRVLNEYLASTAYKNKDAGMWRNARETFNTLSNLTKTVDRSLSIHVLLSFVNSFYFICMQLLHTVRHDNNTVYENIYFSCSFGFLLMRAVAVSLLGATIYDESRAVKRALFSVSSDSYCDEVDRFLVQVTTDDIALTGSNFFNVTRSLLLTVVGTITTYEVVLVQFKGLNSK